MEGVCRGRKRLMAGLFCPTTYHRVVMVVPTCGSCVVYLLQKRMRNAEKKEINLLNLESQISSQEARSQESIAKICIYGIICTTVLYDSVQYSTTYDKV